MANWEYEVAKLIFYRNEESYKTVKSKDSAYDNNDKTYIDSIYNRLKGMVKAVNSIDSTFPFKLDEEEYSLQEISEFLEYLMELVDSDEAVLKKMDVIEYFSEEQESKLPNKNLLSNIKKGDAEDELDLLSCHMIKRGDYVIYGNSFKRCFNYNRQRYNIDSTVNKQEFGRLIRINNEFNQSFIVECFDEFKRRYCYNLSNNINARKKCGSFQYDIQEAMYLILEEIDVLEFIVMQIIIYKIMCNDNLKSEKRKEMMVTIRDACKDFYGSFIPKTDKAEKQNIFYSFAIYLMFLSTRNEYKAYGDVMKILIEQMASPEYDKNVDDKYKYSPQYITDLDIDKQIFYIMEGKEVRKDRFKENIANCMHFISLLDSITGRWLGADYLQHIKVVYREVILDDLKYNSKTARTIMRNIEDKEYPYFDFIKDSIFVREKISRGLYREKDVVELYELKCEIQWFLQGTILKIFTNYDEVRIARDFNSVYKRYRKIFVDTFEEFQ